MGDGCLGMWLPLVGLHVHARSGVLGVRVLIHGGGKDAGKDRKGSVLGGAGKRGSLASVAFLPVRSVRASRLGGPCRARAERAYFVVIKASDVPPAVKRQRRRFGALLLEPAATELRWRNEQLTLFALAWAANNLTLTFGCIYLLYALLGILDDAAKAGGAAGGALLTYLLTAYTKSAALVLLGKDVAIPLVVASLPRLEDIRSERARRLVAKLGGSFYHEHM